jgi:hypothetical protein
MSIEVTWHLKEVVGLAWRIRSSVTEFCGARKLAICRRPLAGLLLQTRLRVRSSYPCVSVEDYKLITG